MKKQIICPHCNQECYINLDEWGYTPYHIHCNHCDINIGCTNIEKGIELLKQYHNKNTWIEFYSNKIQIHYESDKGYVKKP